LKNILTISFFFVLLVSGNISHASVNDLNKKENNNEPTAKENLASTPAKSPVVTPKNEEHKEAIVAAQPAYNNIKDTTNLNSVCRFNYIFYFIYKLKYDEKGQSTGYLEYEF